MEQSIEVEQKQRNLEQKQWWGSVGAELVIAVPETSSDGTSRWPNLRFLDGISQPLAFGQVSIRNLDEVSIRNLAAGLRRGFDKKSRSLLANPFSGLRSPD